VCLLAEAGYTGPLILHGLNEQQVDGCVAFLQGKLAAIPGVATALSRQGKTSV